MGRSFIFFKNSAYNTTNKTKAKKKGDTLMSYDVFVPEFPYLQHGTPAKKSPG